LVRVVCQQFSSVAGGLVCDDTFQPIATINPAMMMSSVLRGQFM
jgi:hypothetical protein